MSKTCCCNHEEHKHEHHEHHHHEHEHCGCGHEHHHHEHEHCGCGYEHHHHEHGCGCGCHHEHSEPKIMYTRIALAVLLGILGVVLKGWVSVVSFAAAYIIIGYDILIGSVKDIFKYRTLGENLLMTIASLGAFALGEYVEAVAVMLLYQVGEMLQERAVEKSRNAVSALTAIRAETVAVEMADGSVIQIHPEEVKAGDIFVVKPGGLIPLDGVIINGSCEVDTKALTGESLPIYKKEGEQVLGGSANLSGLIKVKATGTYTDSTVAKILRLVEESESRKSPAESFIRKFAKIYTPVVFAIAAFVAFVLPLISGEPLGGYVYSALVFLTVSCPCAFVISVPLTYFAGIGGASKKGVLIKGANYIDLLAKADTFVFDKTGTLTDGAFFVTGVYPCGLTENELLNIASAAESVSNHPIAKAVCEYFPNTDISVLSAKEIPGLGISANTSLGEVLAGSALLLENEGIEFETCNFAGSVVFVALNKKYIGAVEVNTKLREEAVSAVNKIRSLGVKNIAMLTGDNENRAAFTAKELGITAYKSGLLPADKVEAFQSCGGKNSVFVGDGLNDAPVLTVAPIGIAMGGIGSDSALEAADIVIMDDNLSRIADAVSLSRKTRRIVIQNVVLSLAVKLAVMSLSLFGMMWLWLSIIADVGVCLVAVLNSLRAFKTE